MSRPTESGRMWLSDIADGEWHSLNAIAAGRGCVGRARGGVGAMFHRFALAGWVEWRYHDKSEWRITPAGLAALSQRTP